MLSMKRETLIVTNKLKLSFLLIFMHTIYIILHSGRFVRFMYKYKNWWDTTTKYLGWNMWKPVRCSIFCGQNFIQIETVSDNPEELTKFYIKYIHNMKQTKVLQKGKVTTTHACCAAANFLQPTIIIKICGQLTIQDLVGNPTRQTEVQRRKKEGGE